MNDATAEIYGLNSRKDIQHFMNSQMRRQKKKGKKIGIETNGENERKPYKVRGQLRHHLFKEYPRQKSNALLGILKIISIRPFTKILLWGTQITQTVAAMQP